MFFLNFLRGLHGKHRAQRSEARLPRGDLKSLDQNATIETRESRYGQQGREQTTSHEKSRSDSVLFVKPLSGSRTLLRTSRNFGFHLVLPGSFAPRSVVIVGSAEL